MRKLEKISDFWQRKFQELGPWSSKSTLVTLPQKGKIVTFGPFLVPLLFGPPKMPLVFGNRSLGTGLREFYEAALLVGCKLFILFDTEYWEEQLK